MEETFRFGTLADIEAIENVPLAERVRENSTFELIERGAALAPEATALSVFPRGDAYTDPVQVSYREFLGKVRQTANLLHDLAVGPTDVVTYLLPNLAQTHYVLWGAEAVGIANPVNPLLEAATIRDICVAAGTKVLVALGEQPGSEIWDKVEQIRGEIPTLRAVVRVLGPSDPEQGVVGFEESVERYPSDRLDFSREIQPDDIASLYHTGGTTGRPKLARRTHYNEVVLAWDIRAGTDLQPGDAVLCGLPLFHCNATCVTGLTPFSVGAHVVLLTPAGYRDPTVLENFFRIVDRYRPSLFSAVPTVLKGLLEVPVGDADISCLKYAVCGAAPLSVEVFRRFEEHSGMKILEGYGLTEAACASSINPKDGERKVGSIGLRLPYQQVKVVRLDADGNYVGDAEPGEIGTLCIGGPTVFAGYVEPEHNAGIWVQGDWLNTGDLGRQDADGYFWLTGRKKELIIRGGHNIDPATIEEVLYQLPGVALAAAVGRPDAHAGEVPVAYVQLARDAAASRDQLLQWARERIGERAAVPKDIQIVEQMPLTAVGKIFKPALRWDAVRRVYASELAALGELARDWEVSVREDRIHGTLATICVEPAAGANRDRVEQRIQEILSRYTVRYEITSGA